MRLRAAPFDMPRWIFKTSLTCVSTVCSGLSEVIGSWKMMEMRLPRTCRISGSGAWSKSLPSRKISPVGCCVPGGSRRRIESAETVLPEPDSPTSATVSPFWMSNETLRTASTPGCRARKANAEIFDFNQWGHLALPFFNCSSPAARSVSSRDRRESISPLGRRSDMGPRLHGDRRTHLKHRRDRTWFCAGRAHRGRPRL